MWENSTVYWPLGIRLIRNVTAASISDQQIRFSTMRQYNAGENFQFTFRIESTLPADSATCAGGQSRIEISKIS